MPLCKPAHRTGFSVAAMRSFGKHRDRLAVFLFDVDNVKLQAASACKFFGKAL
jgi:hypothetical protein